MTSVKYHVFELHPVTLEMATPDQTIVAVGSRAEILPFPDEGYIELQLWANEDYNAVQLASIDVEQPGLMVATTRPHGYRLTLRATTPHDAIVSSIQAQFPMPVPLIAAYVSGDAMNPELEAVVADDGTVMTIAAVSDAGMFLRYSGAWVELTDLDQIDGYSAVPVRDEALETYDPLDQAGQTVNIDQLPVRDVTDLEPYIPVSPNAAPTPITEPVTASAEVPVFETARDLPAAQAAAEADPSVRWYVERRAQALGLEVEWPWQR